MRTKPSVSRRKKTEKTRGGTGFFQIHSIVPLLPGGRDSAGCLPRRRLPISKRSPRAWKQLEVAKEQSPRLLRKKVEEEEEDLQELSPGRRREAMAGRRERGRTGRRQGKAAEEERAAVSLIQQFPRVLGGGEDEMSGKMPPTGYDHPSSRFKNK